LGATLVAVNTKYRSHEVHYILANSHAQFLILQLNFRKIDFAQVVEGVDASNLPHLKTIMMVDADESTPATLLSRPVVHFLPTLSQTSGATNAQSASDALALEDLPVIFFTTSGTTKGPKLVVHTQKTLSEHVRHIATGYQFGAPGDALQFEAITLERAQELDAARERPAQRTAADDLAAKRDALAHQPLAGVMTMGIIRRRR
jgi:fatty-acyl-CoA synthase